MKLSKRQKEVLDFIRASIDQNKMPPTYREIGQALGIASTNGVADHVKALIKKGYLSRSGGKGASKARGLMLTEKSAIIDEKSIVDVPLLGQVAAGVPIQAAEEYETTLRFDASLAASPRPLFALRVRGESMIDEGIHDGDIVIVRQQNTARDGNIVVALIEEEATVKYYFRERESIRLQPANSMMSPIYINPDDEACIQGVVIGVYRSYAF